MGSGWKAERKYNIKFINIIKADLLKSQRKGYNWMGVQLCTTISLTMRDWSEKQCTKKLYLS